MPSFMPLCCAWRRASSNGCSTHCPRDCTCVVMVNSSSFSGRRLPLRSTTLPMAMRPITGGVIIKPLIMKCSNKKVLQGQAKEDTQR